MTHTRRMLLLVECGQVDGVKQKKGWWDDFTLSKISIMHKYISWLGIILT